MGELCGGGHGSGRGPRLQEPGGGVPEQLGGIRVERRRGALHQHDTAGAGEADPAEGGVIGRPPLAGQERESRQRRAVEDQQPGIGREMPTQAAGIGVAELTGQPVKRQRDTGSVAKQCDGALDDGVGHVASGSRTLHHAGSERAEEWPNASTDRRVGTNQ